MALAASEASHRRQGYLTAPLGLLWLLFFPNAPYMLTDFIHLRGSSTTPLWYDGLMISSFAWTALVLGFVSLYLMQTIWRRVAGSASPGSAWSAPSRSGSIGVYIGRYVGYNSWDALLHPSQIAHLIDSKVENPFHHPRLAASLAILTGFLTIAYSAFYWATSLQLATRR